MSSQSNVGNSGEAPKPQEESTAARNARMSVCSSKTAPITSSLPSAVSSHPVTPQPPRSAPLKAAPATARRPAPRQLGHTRRTPMPAMQSARTANNSPTARTPSTEALGGGSSRSPSGTRLPGVRSVPTPALHSATRRASLSPSQDTLRDATQALRQPTITNNNSTSHKTTPRGAETYNGAGGLRHTRHRARIVPPHPVPPTAHAVLTRLPTDMLTTDLYKPHAEKARDEEAKRQKAPQEGREDENALAAQPESTPAAVVHAHSQEPETRKKKHVAFGAVPAPGAPHSSPSPPLAIPEPPSFDETQLQAQQMHPHTIGEADSSVGGVGHIPASHHEADDDGFGSISMAPWERKMHEIMRAGSIITGMNGTGLESSLLNPLLQPHNAIHSNKPHHTAAAATAAGAGGSYNMPQPSVPARPVRSVTPPRPAQHASSEAEVKYPPDSPPSREVNEETFLELSATPGLGLSLYQSLQRSREQGGLPLTPNAATPSNSHSPTHRSPNTASVPGRSHRTTPGVSRVPSSQTPLYACASHYPTPPPPPLPQQQQQAFAHDEPHALSTDPRPSMLGISFTPSAAFFHAMAQPMQSEAATMGTGGGGSAGLQPNTAATYPATYDETRRVAAQGNTNNNDNNVDTSEEAMTAATYPTASSVPMATVNAADAAFAQRQQLQRNSFAFAGVAAAYQAMHNNNNSFTNMSFLRDPLNLSMATDALNVNRPALIAELQRRREKLKRHLAQLQHEATERNIFAIVRTSNASQLQYLLQERLCNVNERDYNQCTPLHVAASEGDLTMVRVLVSFDADLYAVDRFGRTPLDCAASNRHGSVGRFLIAALRNKQMGMAAEGGAAATHTLLHAQAAADANGKDSNQSAARRPGSPAPLLQPPAKNATYTPETAAPPRGGPLHASRPVTPEQDMHNNTAIGGEGGGHEARDRTQSASSSSTTTALHSTSHTACGESHIPVFIAPPYLAGGGSPTRTATPSSEQPTPLFTHAQAAFQSSTTSSSANTTTGLRHTASTLSPVNGATAATATNAGVHPAAASRLPTPPHITTATTTTTTTTVAPPHNAAANTNSAQAMPAPQRSRLYDVNGSFIDMVNVSAQAETHGTRLPPLLTRHVTSSSSVTTSASTTPAFVTAASPAMRVSYSAANGGSGNGAALQAQQQQEEEREGNSKAARDAAYDAERRDASQRNSEANETTPEEGRLLPALLTSQQFTAATAMTSVHGDNARHSHSAARSEHDWRRSAAEREGEEEYTTNSAAAAHQQTASAIAGGAAVTASQLDNASYGDLGIQTLDEYRHDAQLLSARPAQHIAHSAAADDENEAAMAAAAAAKEGRSPSSAAATRPLLTPWCATCGRAHSPLVACVASAAERRSTATSTTGTDVPPRPTSTLPPAITSITNVNAALAAGKESSSGQVIYDEKTEEPQAVRPAVVVGGATEEEEEAAAAAAHFEELEDATTRAAILAEEQEAAELMMSLPAHEPHSGSRASGEDSAGQRAREASATAAAEADNMNASDKTTAKELASTSQLQSAVQFYSSHTTISDTVSVIVCMVGLPGRGKSFIGTRLTRYMNWKGVPCRVFNAGQYRRQLLGATNTASADFFNPDNPQGKMLREKMAELACEGLVHFLTTHSVAVGILDATNTTKDRRSRLQAYFAREAKQRGVAYRLLFIESICTDEAIITENILRSKCENDDFKSVPDVNTVIAEFRDRIQQYERVYEPLDESEGLSFIKIINVKHHVILHKVHPGLGSRIAFFLLNLHPVAYPIYITLPGETIGDEKNVFGGDERLTARGEAYARALKQFIQDRYVPNMVIFHATNNSVLRTLRPLLEDDGTTNTTAASMTNSPNGAGLSPEDAATAASPSQPLPGGGGSAARGPTPIAGHHSNNNNNNNNNSASGAGSNSGASHAGSPLTAQLSSVATTWSTAAVYGKYAVGGYAGRKEAMPIEIGRHHHHNHNHNHSHHHSGSKHHPPHHNSKDSKDSAAHRRGGSSTQSSHMGSHPQSNTSAQPTSTTTNTTAAVAVTTKNNARSPSSAQAASPNRRLKSYTFPVSQGSTHGLQLEGEDHTGTTPAPTTATPAPSSATNKDAAVTPDAEVSMPSESEASSEVSKSEHHTNDDAGSASDAESANSASGDEQSGGDDDDDEEDEEEEEVVDEVLCPVPGLDNINYGRFSGHSAAWIKERYPRLSSLLYDNTTTTASTALTPTPAHITTTTSNTTSNTSNGAKSSPTMGGGEARGEGSGGKSEAGTTSGAAPIHMRIKDAAKYFQHNASGVDPHLAYCVQFPNGESCRQVNVRLEPALMAIMRTQSPVFIVAPAVPAQGILAFFADIIPELSTTVRLPRHCVVEIGVKEDITIHPLLVGDGAGPRAPSSTTTSNSPVVPPCEVEAAAAAAANKAANGVAHA